jgi:hypothetical protein
MAPKWIRHAANMMISRDVKHVAMHLLELHATMERQCRGWTHKIKDAYMRRGLEVEESKKRTVDIFDNRKQMFGMCCWRLKAKYA